jgi:tRNA threonylcarbamoyladenosine biosynthesis protein TsaE
MKKPFLTLSLENEAQTLAFGAALGVRLRAGDFIALTGPLGAGKTTLARGLIRAFVGSQIDVPSPTFTLVQTYSGLSSGSKRALLASPLIPPLTQSGLDLYHFDLYRLKNAEEVWELGWEDIAGGVALVEWPDKAGEHLPDDRLDIALSFQGDGRIAQFFTREPESWKDRLNGA